MKRQRKPRQKGAAQKAGLSPGTLTYVGPPREGRAVMTLIRYGLDFFKEYQAAPEVPEFAPPDDGSIAWLSLEGLHDTINVQLTGDKFAVHPLVLEDIVNTNHRPKAEDFEEYLFLVLKAAAADQLSGELTYEHICIVIGPQFVLSFSETPLDILHKARERLRNSQGRMRKHGPDYLAYVLVDSIVDNYFVVLEQLEEKIDRLEYRVLEEQHKDILNGIYQLKRDVLSLKKVIWPLRDAVSTLQKSESTVIREGTEVFLRDLYDHIIHVMAAVEESRDALTGITELYMSVAGNRMNEIMKVLTIMASIFIPLTLVVGFYGMNFDLPEFKWPHGHRFVWALMGLITLVMLIFFRRKRWL